MWKANNIFIFVEHSSNRIRIPTKILTKLSLVTNIQTFRAYSNDNNNNHQTCLLFIPPFLDFEWNMMEMQQTNEFFFSLFCHADRIKIGRRRQQSMAENMIVYCDRTFPWKCAFTYSIFIECLLAAIAKHQ